MYYNAVGENTFKLLAQFWLAVQELTILFKIHKKNLCFEINFAESTILGMVGAGGIGYSISASMSGYNLGRAGISIIMVFAFASKLTSTKGSPSSPLYCPSAAKRFIF